MQIDEKAMADVLSARFRLTLSGCVIQTGNGARFGVRASDIPQPNGFAVAVAKGWKSLEADFLPDTYAGELIRAMGQKASVSNQSFVSLARSFDRIGNRINLKVNGSVLSLEDALPPPPWNKFELNVRQLTDVASSQEDSLQSAAENIASACLALILMLLPLEEDESGSQPLFEAGLPEGACTIVTVNRYERNPTNRAACIAAHGSKCQVCGFDFGEVYGSLGHGYIEVHHRVPVSKMGAAYRIDPVKDLVPLCANCHAAVHRTDPPLAPEDLSTFLMARRK